MYENVGGRQIKDYIVQPFHLHSGCCLLVVFVSSLTQGASIMDQMIISVAHAQPAANQNGLLFFKTYFSQIVSSVVK